MTKTEEIRALLGISRAEFARRYKIPIRTLEDWDSGKSNPPVYVAELLERVVKEDMNMKYALILSTRGNEEVVDVGDKNSMIKREDALRKECRKKDPDGAEMDCYIISEDEWKKREEAKKFWDELTPEDKKDIIVVNGKKYVRKIYEKNHEVKLWYAVQRDRDDDWGDGSFDKDEAIEMLKEQGYGLIAVIDGDVCIEEIEYDDIAD